jgi:hypothetical protein
VVVAPPRVYEAGLRWLRTAQSCLALDDRTYICAQCGLVLDHDRHAARNILARGKTLMSG